MKKVLFTMMLAAGCMLIGAKVYAQNGQFESLLPVQVQKSLPTMREDYAFIAGKVAALNPGYKNKDQLQANVYAAVEQLKKQKPAYSSIKAPEAMSFNQLVAAKTKQLGAESGVVKILVLLGNAMEKAGSTDELVAVMGNVLKSPVFAALSAEDKNMFYTAFAAAKTSFDYTAKNNLGYIGGFSINGGGNYGDDDYLPMPRAACMWGYTMAGAIAGCAGGPGGASIGAAIGFFVGNHACG